MDTSSAVDGLVALFVTDPCTDGMPYPCDANSINVVSLSLACSGVALLFAIFLTKKVNIMGVSYHSFMLIVVTDHVCSTFRKCHVLLLFKK